MTEPGGVLLDRVQLERAFTALGERLVRRGVVADVFVVGDAAAGPVHAVAQHRRYDRREHRLRRGIWAAGGADLGLARRGAYRRGGDPELTADNQGYVLPESGGRPMVVERDHPSWAEVNAEHHERIHGPATD